MFDWMFIYTKFCGMPHRISGKSLTVGETSLLYITDSPERSIDCFPSGEFRCEYHMKGIILAFLVRTCAVCIASACVCNNALYHYYVVYGVRAVAVYVSSRCVTVCNAVGTVVRDNSLHHYDVRDGYCSAAVKVAGYVTDSVVKFWAECAFGSVFIVNGVANCRNLEGVLARFCNL